MHHVHGGYSSSEYYTSLATFVQLHVLCNERADLRSNHRIYSEGEFTVTRPSSKKSIQLFVLFHMSRSLSTSSDL